MSLPLRLPYCSPARRLRAVLLFPCFRAPVTPPPSPAWSQDPDSEPEGDASEGCSEDDAWLRGRVLSASATPQGWVCPGPRSLPLVSPGQPRTRQPPTVTPGPCPPSPIPGSRSCVRRPQPARPPLLNRRPSAPQGSRPAKDRQPGFLGTVPAGGKEPEPKGNSQNEYEQLWRIRVMTPPPLSVPRPVAKGGIAGRGACLVKKSAKLNKPASASQEKCPATCRKIVLELKKGVGKPR